MSVCDGIRLIGVDGASGFRAHHVGVDVVGIGATAGAVTVGEIARGNKLTGVQG